MPRVIEPFLPPLDTYEGTACAYCPRTMTRSTFDSHLWPSRDHAIPREIGGRLEPCNRVVCCRGCNHAKGNRTLEEFWEDLMAKPPGRRRSDPARVEAVIIALFMFRRYRNCRQVSGLRAQTQARVWKALGLSRLRAALNVGGGATVSRETMATPGGEIHAGQ